MNEDSFSVPAPVKHLYAVTALLSSAAALVLLASFAGEAALATGAIAAAVAAATFAAWAMRGHELAARRCEHNLTRLRLADAVYANSSEAMLVTDAQGRIITANAAFERITGYTAQETIGRNPRFQSSGRQDIAFYKSMWVDLLDRGVWQGEIWNRRRSGEMYAVWQTITAVRDDTGKTTHYVSLFSDISVLKAAEERLRHLAYHDPLTGLSNRLLFTNSLNQSIARAERHSSKLAVLFIDLDHFKSINDTFGHASGDALLESVGKRLRDNVRAQDVVARLGGDEFTVLLEDVGSREEISHLASKLIDTIGQPLSIQGRSLLPSASIGIAVFPDDASASEELMQTADAALYRAKAAGRRSYSFYTEELTRQAAEQLRIENMLGRAVLNGELSLHYQPQFTTEGHRFAGFEAFVRWQHADLGLLLPGSFVPVAEESGLIQTLTEWVIGAACRQAREWLDAGLQPQRISINLSGKRLQHERLAAVISQAMQTWRHSPHDRQFRLGVEISESVLQTGSSLDLLEALSEQGVDIAINDFGTSHLSISMLQRLPVSSLKLERSFVQKLPQDAESLALTRAVIATAKSLNLHVGADGVEASAQLECLKALGCSQVQGFLLARPMSTADATAWLHRWSCSQVKAAG